jgi:hypothetical protein
MVVTVVLFPSVMVLVVWVEVKRLVVFKQFPVQSSQYTVPNTQPSSLITRYSSLITHHFPLTPGHCCTMCKLCSILC